MTSADDVRSAVRFTVTKVSSDEEASESDELPDGDITERQGQTRCTLQLPAAPCAQRGPPESEGDTLTNNSITKLLPSKVKTTTTSVVDDIDWFRRITTSNGHSSLETGLIAHRPSLRKRLLSNYESQDYEQIENELFLRAQTNRGQIVRRRWLARWIVCFLIGAGTAIVASVIELSIESIAHFKFACLKLLLDRCVTGTCLTGPLLAWVSTNVGLVLIGSLLVTYLEPQAAGSGIPQIKCYLNGVKIPGLLKLRTLLAKAVGVILSVSGGLACGKEGPMIHSGSIVGAGISQGRSRFLNKDFKVFEYLRSDLEKRDFVSAGAAAGVSAAFGAPVGGVLFSLEEGSSFWNQSLTWRIVFASMVATFAVNVLLSAVRGHASDLSNAGLLSFGQFEHITYGAIEIPVFLLMAVVGGFLGAAFNAINSRLTVFRKRYVRRRWVRVLEAVLVASSSAVLGFLLIVLIPSCSTTHNDDENGHDSVLVQMNCDDGQHNTMASIFLKTPEASLINLLHAPVDAFGLLDLGLFAVLYYLLACWTYGLSVSSGVFIPSLLTGAAWGRVVGLLVHLYWPEGNSSASSVGKYALIGAACQLGGTVRMTISLTVILLECTGDVTFGLPIVMVLIVAKWMGDIFNTGLYDLHVQLMGIPFLPWEPPEVSYNINASQVMNSPVITLRSRESVSRIVEVLGATTDLHGGFPVVEHQGELNAARTTRPASFGRCKGLILRSQLCLLLKYRVFVGEAEGRSSPASEAAKKQIRLEHFTNVYAADLVALDGNITEADKSGVVDLQTFMNPSPFTVPMTSSLPHMFRLFRGLGLRHLIVVNDSNEVVGMVTRKDLAKYRLDAKGVNIRLQELRIQPE